MASNKDRLIYIGTAKGLFRAEPEGEGYKATKLGQVVSQAARESSGGRLSVIGKLMSQVGITSTDSLRGPIVIDQKDPRTLFVGTEHFGVYKSSDGGATWEPVNNGLTQLEIWSLAQNPLTGDLFAGTEPSAVFKSSNGGASWQQCGDLSRLPRYKEWTFPRPPHISHVKHITFSQHDPQLVYCAVEEGWLIRSRDGGASWENLTDGVEFDAHAVALLPNNEQKVIATSGNGFYHSTDGGDHFSKTINGLDRRYLSPPALHPDRPNVIFLSAAAYPPPAWFIPGRGGADSAFYRSDDEGRNWTKLTGTPFLKGGCWTTSIDPDDPDTVAIGLHNGEVWLTENGGQSFRPVLTDLPVIGNVTIIQR